MIEYLSCWFYACISKEFLVQKSHWDGILCPLAVQYLSDCVNFMGMSPTVFDVLLVWKLSKLSRIHQNVTQLVDVIAKVGNQMYLNKVEITFGMYQFNTLVVLVYTVCVARPSHL